MTEVLPLAELVELNPEVQLNRGDEYPFVDMAAVKPSRRYVEQSQTRVFKPGGARFCAGDTLFARITPCLENGKIAQFKAPSGTIAFGSTEFIVFRSRPSISDPGYVYYLAKSRLVRGPAEKSMSGASGRQRADLEVIANVSVPAPPLSVQRSIASTLSAYDDLIDNNLRRIQILEEMARALYREWFVEFRFPGHERFRVVESPVGSVPEHWPICRASDAIEVDPSPENLDAGEKPFVPMGSLSETSMLIGELQVREGKSGTKFRNGDTLFARITPCLENGKTAFVQFLPTDELVALGSTEFIVLRAKTLCPEMVYLVARSEEFRQNAIKSMSGASGRQRVQKECFDKYLFAHPDGETIRAFQTQVSPLFRAVQVTHEKNRTLHETRDLLLPRLISAARSTYPISKSA